MVGVVGADNSAFTTLPAEFMDYEELDKNTQVWRHVSVGVPKDGAVIRRSSRWSAWSPHGGEFPAQARPAVVSRRPDVTDVLMRGMDNRLWQRSYVAGASPPWTGWTPHNDGFALGSDPAVDSMGPDHLHVFALSADRRLWQKWWLGTAT